MTTPDTRAKELAGLIERLEKATGPDGAIDDLLYWTLKQHPAKGPFARIPAYTASIDAALALVERVLPEWRCWFAARQKDEVGEYSFDLRHGRGTGALATASAPTFPLAILLALLLALQESQDAE